jgi:hypothetical protein
MKTCANIKSELADIILKILPSNRDADAIQNSDLGLLDYQIHNYLESVAHEEQENTST